MHTNALLLSFFFIITVFSSICNAIEIHKNGYEIEIYFKEKGDGLHVWGNVEEGRSCEQLNLEIFLRNGDSTELARIATAIRRYSKTRATYRAIDEVYRGGNRKKWFVDSVYTKCLN